MNLDSSLIQVLTTVAGSVGAVYAGLPWLVGKTHAATTLQTVATVCDKVVAALEQTQGAATGAQKKALALDMVNTVLSSMHITVPAPFVDAAVEAAVLGLSMLSPTAPANPATPSSTVVVSNPVSIPPGNTTTSAGPSPTGMGTGPSG